MLTCIKTEDRSLAIDTRTEDSLSVEEISSENLIQQLNNSSLDDVKVKLEPQDVLFGQFQSMRDTMHEDAKVYYQRLRELAGPREENVCKADTVFRSMLLEESLLPESESPNTEQQNSYKPSTIIRLGPAPPVYVRPTQTKPSLLEIYLSSDL
ncbi:uncharacterized protein LOC106884462 [Octopus bimaculoides]|uniref:uncharacterized protein LOC106884462 n=1 Tax=Octopus bimaculoides TaxID=37653 RepID=UPI00071D31B3|nr:uncharacterized protein LOC106884462 [Octopus bimaculoides]|eukprot:XP_014791350.1 PREDICTED: uncharacterized protein LOC106884462 [Octopus bimaculoides]